MNINDFLKMNNHEILTKLETLAENINGFLQKEFYVDPNIQSKARKNDIVTQSDKNAEKLIISNLEALFGRNIGIFSEECGGQVIDDKPSFIIDPIDGSSRFADRKHSFGAFVSLQYQGQIHASLICMPMSDTYWIGVANRLVKHNYLDNVSSTLYKTTENRPKIYVTCGSTFHSEPYLASKADQLRARLYNTHDMRIGRDPSVVYFNSMFLGQKIILIGLRCNSHDVLAGLHIASNLGMTLTTLNSNERLGPCFCKDGISFLLSNYDDFATMQKIDLELKALGILPDFN